MTRSPEPVLLFLADISGYTRFMLANRVDLLHAQAAISELLESIIREVDIPLEISALEGDAVFLYARRGADADSWDQCAHALRAKLPEFFSAFRRKLIDLHQSNMCWCGGCKYLKSLKLKMIVHAGEALLDRVDRFSMVSGVDVILLHRLAKNSVPYHEYALLTAEAHEALNGGPSNWPMYTDTEYEEELGAIPVHVYVPPDYAVPTQPAWHAGIGGKVRAFLRKNAYLLGAVLGTRQRPGYRNLPTVWGAPRDNLGFRHEAGSHWKVSG